MRWRVALRVAVSILFLAVLAGAALAASPADTTERHDGVPINQATPVDHDARPVPAPKERDPNLPAHLYREAIIEELSRIFDIPDKIIWALGPLGVEPNREAANVNAMDEVPNSTWFTNRNHIRSVPPSVIRKGPKDGLRPEQSEFFPALDDFAATIHMDGGRCLPGDADIRHGSRYAG